MEISLVSAWTRATHHLCLFHMVVVAGLFIWVCIEEGRVVSKNLVVASLGGWRKLGRKKKFLVCLFQSVCPCCWHKRTPFVFLQISFSVFDITSPLLSTANTKTQSWHHQDWHWVICYLYCLKFTWHTEGHPVKKGKMVRLEKLDPFSWFISFILLMSPQTKMDGLLLD